jgi:hypothetical protein
MCEQLILQGYSLCVIDPEGNYASLEALPGVMVLGGDDPPPRAREIARALRHPDMSLVIDLSKVRHREKLQYLDTVMDLLWRLRRQTGLPHRIVVDEAHYLLQGHAYRTAAASDLSGQTLITYRVSTLGDAVTLPDDAVILVTKETDPHELETLRRMCRRSGVPLPATMFRDLQPTEAAILPGAEEAGDCVARFTVAPRLKGRSAGGAGADPRDRDRLRKRGGSHRDHQPDGPRPLRTDTIEHLRGGLRR